ncbi:MAG: protein phosphatase 2C domain-containing protein [Gemmatimonadota bacterium]|jgi:protein phosphatase
MTDQPLDGSGIRLSAYGRSDRGRVRANNQDNLLVVDLSRGTPEALQPGDDDDLTVGPVDFGVSTAGAVLMVADGMGGRAGGERASAAAVTTVGEAMVDGSTEVTAAAFVRRLAHAIAEANSAIHAEGSSGDRYRGMGTTATLAGILGDRVYVAQVGDSRAYLVRDGAMARLTRDQSLVQDLIDMGVLSEDDAQSVPSNQILQALGVAPTVEPVLTWHELRRGDLLLLCSDGLSGVVSDADVRCAVEAAEDCGSLCDTLVEMANDRGGPDNITVLAARLGGDGLHAPGEQDFVQARKYSSEADQRG